MKTLAATHASMDEPVPPLLGYHRLRVAVERFRCGLAELDPQQRAQVTDQAMRTLDVEARVLGSAEAATVTIPDARIEEAWRQLQARYPDRAALLGDLASNGLDEAIMRQALQRELRFDAVLRQIGAGCPAATDSEIQLFFELHRARFATPERRQARHLLITVNPAYPENERARALARCERLAASLRRGQQGFGALARRYSECPTALQDGRLGLVEPGQLYPALERALFALAPGAASGPVESDLGFHLLWCERVEPARAATFDEVRPRVAELVQARRQRAYQQAWIESLPRISDVEAAHQGEQTGRRRQGVPTAH